MKQFYEQKLEMQIPHESSLNEVKIIPNLYETLKKYFKFPSSNSELIEKFISKDIEMKNIILNLPEIISEELSYNELTLDFLKETDPHEKILEIVIYSTSDEKTLLLKEDLISDRIIDRYPKTDIEYIILVEPYEE